MMFASAKAKWCPFARQLAGDEDGVAGVNRRYGEMPEKVAPCIGDRCMAWRLHAPADYRSGLSEDEVDSLRDKHHEDALLVAEDDAAADGSKRWFAFVGRAGGYCGLAGSAGAE